MVRLAWNTIKDRKTSIFVYCLSGFLFLWMYIAMFPMIAEQSKSISDMVKAMPQAMITAFGIESMDFTVLGNFVSMENFSFIWPLLAILISVSFATGTITAEIENGTIELLLSQPLSRSKIFAGRFLAGSIVLLLFTILSTLSAYPLCRLHGIDANGSHFYRLAAVAFLFGWAVMGMSYGISAYFSEKGKATFTISGILVLMYVLKIVASLKVDFEKLKYVSFFHYYNPTQAVVHGMVDTTTVWVLGLVGLVGFLCGMYRFTKRDIAV